MPLPGTSRQLIKLLPIAFVPGRHFVHTVPLLITYYALRCLVGCKVTLQSGTQLPQTARQNAVDAGKPSASLLTIYVCAGLTRHFAAYCFKPVTGLIVSRTLAVATVLLFRLEPGG
jgi:hypothetical protein